MTTIAFDGSHLAADCLGCYGDVKSLAKISKIWYLQRKGRRAVVAGCGNATTLMGLAKLFLDNLPEVRLHMAAIPNPGFPGEGSLIAMDIETKRVFHMGQDASCVEVTGNISACGSGREFALGAMHHGAGAASAVHTAMAFDPWTGKDVEAVRLDADFNSANWTDV